MFEQIRRDFSVQSMVAGLVVVLVGMTSGAALVFQSAIAYGLSSEAASSWLGAICIGIGLTTLALTLKYKNPVLTAWSTAGLALVAAGSKDFSASEAIGACLTSAGLVLICGVTGWFEKVMNRIPVSMAAALLAGVLIHFSLDSFSVGKEQPALIGALFFAYLVSKRFVPRFTMLLVLVVGIFASSMLNILNFGEIHFSWTHFTLMTPTWSLKATLGLAVPLFIVTMVSQYLTGISVIRSNGYKQPLSPLLTVTSLVNLGTAFWGGISICLAAITAAIGVGPESHPDPNRRYIAGLVSGFVYLLIGFICGTVTSIFSAFPKALIIGIVGVALLTTIANSLQTALNDADNKEAAFITFIVTASGITLFGVNSAFWGIVAGLLAKAIFGLRK